MASSGRLFINRISQNQSINVCYIILLIAYMDGRIVSCTNRHVHLVRPIRFTGMVRVALILAHVSMYREGTEIPTLFSLMFLPCIVRRSRNNQQYIIYHIIIYGITYMIHQPLDLYHNNVTNLIHIHFHNHFIVS
jgi:hypothetical protein